MPSRHPLWTRFSIAHRSTPLRRIAKEELSGSPTISVQQCLKQRPPADLGFPAKTEKVAQYLFPGPMPLGGAYAAQIVKSPQHRMGTSKPTKHHRQPAGNEPRGNQTIRINLHRGPMKAPLSPLPALDAQEQGSCHGVHGVLKVGDQLAWQQGEGPRDSSTQKARNGNPFLLEDRKQLGRIPPVRGDLSITVFFPTDGAGRSDEGGKINPTGKKRSAIQTVTNPQRGNLRVPRKPAWDRCSGD